MEKVKVLKARIGLVDVHDGRAVVHLRAGRARLAFKMTRPGKSKAEISAEIHAFFGVAMPGHARQATTGNTGLSGVEVLVLIDASRLSFGSSELLSRAAAKAR